MSAFNDFLKDFKAGHLNDTLTKKLQDVVEAVEHHQKPGKLTLEFTLTPKRDGEIHTTAKFKTKTPERDTMEQILYATPDNNLIASDPKQPEMFPAAPVREAGAAPRQVKPVVA